MRASVDAKTPRKSRRWLWWTGGGFGVLVLAVILFLAFFDWNWLRGPVSAEASRLSHRPVRIEGNLRVHLLSWTPSASADRVWIGNPAWAHGGEFADAGRLTASVRLLPLLFGIGLLFWNGRSAIGWLLTVGGALFILAGVIMNMHIYFQPTSLFNTIVMLVLLVGGSGLVVRSLSPHYEKR